eukprot:403333054
MVKLKVLTILKLPQGQQPSRRVKTVDNIPKILSFVSQNENKLNTKSRILDGEAKMGRIEEDLDEEENKSKKSKHHHKGGVSSRVGHDHNDGRQDSCSRMDDLSLGSSDEGSSVDGDEDDEDRVYQQILASQNSPQTVGQVDDLVDKETIDLLRVCARFKYPTEDEISNKFVNFGPRKRNKTLVLDMDETLIHAKFMTSPDQEKNDDGHFTIHLSSRDNEDVVKVSVKMRPFLDNCLEHLAKIYEIAVFTAGEQSYADAVLDQLDEGREIIQHRLYRQHCVNTDQGMYVKDLRIIRDRNLSDVILVDNSIISFAFNMDNGVPISGFVRQPNDEEFLYLVSYLEEIYSYPDVREHIAKTFKLRDQMEKHCGTRGH